MSRRVLAVLALASGAVLAIAAPASAHALLEGANPVAGSSVSAAPNAVTLSYSESVTVSPDSVQVLNTAGQRVDRGDTHRGTSGSQVVVDLRPGLGKGTYVVSWRAISADSHPVAGAFTYGVGVSPDPTAASRIGGRAGSTVVGTLDGIARFATEGGIALGLGGALFLLVLWPRGLAQPGARRAVWTGWVALAVGALALLLLEGPYGAGLGVSAAFRSSLLSQTLDTRYGKLTLLRLVLVVVTVPVLHSLLARDLVPARARDEEAGREVETGEPPRRGRYENVALAELVLIGVVVAVTVAASGHAGTSSLAPLATVSLTLHVLAISVWLGGLVMLAGFTLRADGPELRRVVARWSLTAIGAVVVIVATGVFQSWREVASWGALGGTTYGQLLLVKLGLVAVMLCAGFAGNRWVARQHRTVVFATQDAPHRGAAAAAPLRPAPGAPGASGASDAPGASSASGASGRGASSRGSGVGTLRLGVAIETVLAVGVLIVTALLVNAPPGRTSYAPPFHDTVVTGPLKAAIEVTPTRRGVERISVRVSGQDGKPRTVEEVGGQLSLPSRNVGPLDVRFVPAGPGLMIADAVPVPYGGRWKLTVTMRVDDFDQYSATVSYHVL
jgi:copper transport protein